jgi:hypothetical protein
MKAKETRVDRGASPFITKVGVPPIPSPITKAHTSPFVMKAGASPILNIKRRALQRNVSISYAPYKTHSQLGQNSGDSVHGEEGLNEVEMRDSYLKMEVPTGVDEDYGNDVNEPDILGFTDDDVEFQVHNIEEMVCNVERHGKDDQYSNGELAKYKKMIEDSKKPLYHGCATLYMRLFAMVKLFQLKASNRWSDCSL